MDRSGIIWHTVPQNWGNLEMEISKVGKSGDMSISKVGKSDETKSSEMGKSDDTEAPK